MNPGFYYLCVGLFVGGVVVGAIIMYLLTAGEIERQAQKLKQSSSTLEEAVKKSKKN